MFVRRSGTSVNSTPSPSGEFQTILPATVIGSFCKRSTWNIRKMSSLIAYVRRVLINTPPRLMFLENALKTELNARPSATRQQGFLGCFLRSLRFNDFTAGPLHAGLSVISAWLGKSLSGMREGGATA